MFTNKFEVGLPNANVEDFDDCKDYIHSYFFGITPLEECRRTYLFMHRLHDVVDKINKHGSKSWVVYNNLLATNKQRVRKIDTMMDLWTEYKFTGYIVADMLAARVLLSYNVPLTISTVNDIRDMNDVDRLYNEGFKNIVLSYKVNRNFDFISECCTRYKDATFIIITNETCESNCQYRTSHFLRVMAGESSKYQCIMTDRNINTPEWKLKFLQNTALYPENIEILNQFPNLIFKLPTRVFNFPTTIIKNYIDMYMRKIDYNSIFDFFTHHMDINGCDIIKPKPETIKAWQNCKNQCYKCNICKNELGS